MLIFVFGDINDLILYEALEWHKNKECFLGKCNVSKKGKDERNSLNKCFVKAIKEPWKDTGNLTFYFELKTAFLKKWRKNHHFQKFRCCSKQCQLV